MKDYRSQFDALRFSPEEKQAMVDDLLATAPEIAQLLGRLPSTVNTQLRRGREQLKTLLEKEGYP